MIDPAPNDVRPAPQKPGSSVRRDGPGGHVGSMVLGVNTAIRWHVLILAMLRRLHVQWGASPEVVEGELAGEGKRSHVGMVREAGARIGIVAGMMDLTVHDLRAIAKWLATRVTPNSIDHPDYPDGWRSDLREILGATSAPSTAPRPSPRPDREPGDDDE